MTICDLSPFYCDNGGGIRTFHRARMDWFRRQTRHRYVLIAPGREFSITTPSPDVWLVRVYGVPLSLDRDRYRWLVDYPTIRFVVEGLRPDVIEAHDAFFSMPFAWWLRRQGVHRGILTSFCHAEPISTYIAPKAPRVITDWATRGLSLLRRQFDATFVASESTRAALVSAGVDNVVKIGFGCDPELLRLERHAAGTRRTRLLYAGRLDDDKEFGLVMDALPALLRHADVRITVVGTGKYAARVRAIRHPRFTYLGFLAERSAMRAVFGRHDILLAPGRYETFGLAALEASAAGMVVVGPDQGGTAELLEQMRSPMRFPAGDSRMFVERVEAAISGDEPSLLKRARAVAARYGTWNDAVARQVALYESMVGEHGAAEALTRTA